MREIGMNMYLQLLIVLLVGVSMSAPRLEGKNTYKFYAADVCKGEELFSFVINSSIPLNQCKEHIEYDLECLSIPCSRFKSCKDHYVDGGRKLGDCLGCNYQVKGLMNVVFNNSHYNQTIYNDVRCSGSLNQTTIRGYPDQTAFTCRSNTQSVPLFGCGYESSIVEKGAASHPESLFQGFW